MVTTNGIANKRRALLNYLEGLGQRDILLSLAEFLDGRAIENSRDLSSVGDEALRRYIGEWLSRHRFGISDNQRRDAWIKAVRALRRYHRQYPELRIGQAITNLTTRYWLEGMPNNHDLVKLVNWELDEANPHIGRPVVVRKSNGSWLLGILLGQGRLEDSPTYVLERDHHPYVFRLESDLRQLIRGGELRIIASDLPEIRFRELLAESITNWFLTHDASEHPWCTGPDQYSAQVREPGRQVLVPWQLAELVGQVVIKAARRDELLAGYLTYQLTGLWPQP